MEVQQGMAELELEHQEDSEKNILYINYHVLINLVNVVKYFVLFTCNIQQ